MSDKPKLPPTDVEAERHSDQAGTKFTPRERAWLSYYYWQSDGAIPPLEAWRLTHRVARNRRPPRDFTTLQRFPEWERQVLRARTLDDARWSWLFRPSVSSAILVLLAAAVIIAPLFGAPPWLADALDSARILIGGFTMQEAAGLIQWQALIAIVIPVVVWLVRRGIEAIAGQVPKALIPLISAVLGAVAAAFTGVDPTAGVVAGTAGVGAFEAAKQIKRAATTP